MRAEVISHFWAFIRLENVRSHVQVHELMTISHRVKVLEIPALGVHIRLKNSLFLG